MFLAKYCEYCFTFLLVDLPGVNILGRRFTGVFAFTCPCQHACTKKWQYHDCKCLVSMFHFSLIFFWYSLTVKLLGWTPLIAVLTNYDYALKCPNAEVSSYRNNDCRLFSQLNLTRVVVRSGVMLWSELTSQLDPAASSAIPTAETASIPTKHAPDASFPATAHPPQTLVCRPIWFTKSHPICQHYPWGWSSNQPPKQNCKCWGVGGNLWSPCTSTA